MLSFSAPASRRSLNVLMNTSRLNWNRSLVTLQLQLSNAWIGINEAKATEHLQGSLEVRTATKPPPFAPRLQYNVSRKVSSRPRELVGGSLPQLLVDQKQPRHCCRWQVGDLLGIPPHAKQAHPPSETLYRTFLAYKSWVTLDAVLFPSPGSRKEINIDTRAIAHHT